MILRSPLSGAKKFFSNTFKTFKSFFNGETYEKLPKETPSPVSLNINPTKWDSQNGTRKKIETNQDKQVVTPLKNTNRNNREKSISVVFHGTTKGEASSSCSRNRGLVLKKLKELKTMEQSNTDYVMDIDEVLHYYSLLTCPSYLEIVDKFFVEIYADLSISDNTARRTPFNNSSYGSRILPKARRIDRAVS